MIRASIHEAKTHLSALIGAVEQHGAVIRICRSGKPVAEIRPIAPTGDPFRQDPSLRGVAFLENPAHPLQEEDWLGSF
jgi:prevent-host-death family protein